jgi:hypothetical protein
MADQDVVLEQSIEADVPLAFAWRFRTDIKTWNDPPPTFELDGPFVEGTSGKTLMPGQEPIVWWIRDVQSGRSFTIEMPLKGATLRFEWHFSAVSERRTTLTQRIILSRGAADVYREQVQTGFAANLATGMAKLAASMETSERAGRTLPETND